jgi:hypothetical protein
VKRILLALALCVPALAWGQYPWTPQQSGCCSSHGGESGFCAINGHELCNDGTASPTCLCTQAPPPPPPPIVPIEGMWWNSSESGSGYAIDVKHGVLVMTIYGYTAAGAPEWYLAFGSLVNNSMTTRLNKFQNGQCISCGYRAPVASGDDGTITVTFTSSSTATLSLPGGRTTQIVPQDF